MFAIQYQIKYEDGLIDRPANFGADFKKPPQLAYRQHENAKGDQSFSADEIRALLKHADINMRAMILLGLQAGFSNVELTELPRSAVKGDWLEWPRAKTATKRRIPLWAETKQALAAAIKAGKPDGDLVFYRNGYRYSDRRYICYDFRKIAKLAGVENHSFYDLRRTHQTISENHSEHYDLAAIQAIMGHVARSRDMSSRYRQFVSDDRLLAVTNAVRKWLGKIPKSVSSRRGLDSNGWLALRRRIQSHVETLRGRTLGEWVNFLNNSGVACNEDILRGLTSDLQLWKEPANQKRKRAK